MPVDPTNAIRRRRPWCALAGLVLLCGATACNGSADAPFSCTVQAYGGAVVRLQSAATGEPITGARVVLFVNANTPVQLDENVEPGLYNYGRAPAGTFEILAEADGYAPRRATVEVAQVGDPRCGPTLLGQVTVELDGPSLVIGRLVDLDTGEPLGVVVRSRAVTRRSR